MNSHKNLYLSVDKHFNNTSSLFRIIKFSSAAAIFFCEFLVGTRTASIYTLQTLYIALRHIVKLYREYVCIPDNLLTLTDLDMAERKASANLLKLEVTDKQILNLFKIFSIQKHSRVAGKKIQVVLEHTNVEGFYFGVC